VITLQITFLPWVAEIARAPSGRVTYRSRRAAPGSGSDVQVMGPLGGAPPLGSASLRRGRPTGRTTSTPSTSTSVPCHDPSRWWDAWRLQDRYPATRWIDLARCSLIQRAR